jgi:carotenoid cleavage dioxygenase-like enzyme
MTDKNDEDVSMDVRFPDIPLYRGWGAPLRIEVDAHDLEVVSGSVPKDLNGSLYRCGPDRQYPPMTADDVFIDGEGMVHRFHFDHGHVDYRSRWVRNERFKLQEAARRSLFGRYRNRYTDDPSVAGKNRGTANTNVVWHGKRLLVLKEDSLPVEVDAVTLKTKGDYNFGGKLDAVSLTAHPKLDMHTGELLAFSYQARGDATTDFAFYIIDANGKIVHDMWFTMPYPGMVHDFAVTDTHVIVPFFPLITDLPTLKRGGPFYQWHPERHSHFAVFPRRGNDNSIRWFRGPAVSAGHMMNACNDGNQLHLDLCLYQGNCFDFFPTSDGTPFKPAPPMLTRLTFDLGSKHDGYEAKLLMQTPCEMPKTDDRYVGKPYRYGYTICRSPSARAGEMGMAAIGCFDHSDSTLTTWEPGASGVQEPNFVVRPGAPEGEGYLLTIVNRLAENRSDLAILNAKRLADGPLAVLRLPVRVRSTFHGMWVPSSALETGRYAT